MKTINLSSKFFGLRNLLLGGLVLVCGTAAHATPPNGPLASYDFYGYNGSGPDPDTATATTPGNAITATVITRASSVADPTYIANSFAFVGADQSNLAGAESAGRYISFTLAPTSGNVVLLKDISFEGFSRNDSADFALTNAAGVLYSTVDVTGDSGSPESEDLSFGLSGQLLHTSTEFRIYVYGSNSYYNENGFGKSNQDIGADFTINGRVIPEPSTYALIGCGLVLLFAAARKQLSA